MIGLYDLSDDEGEKTIRAHCIPFDLVEKPARMGTAVPAQGKLPVISCKPAEFFCRFPVHKATGRILKTTNFKGDTGRIEKSVFMPPLPAYRLIFVCERSMTGPAADRGFLFFLRPAAAVLGQGVSFSVLRAEFPQEKIRVRRCGNGPQWRPPYQEEYSYSVEYQHADRFSGQSPQ